MLDNTGKNLMGSRRELNSEVANKAMGATKTIKVNTKGKVLCDEMREKVEHFILENKPLLILIAR